MALLAPPPRRSDDEAGSVSGVLPAAIRIGRVGIPLVLDVDTVAGAGSVGRVVLLPPLVQLVPAVLRVPLGARLVALLDDHGKRVIAQQLHDQVGLVRYAPPELALKPLKPLGADWTRALDVVLKAVTGTRWQVAMSNDPAEPSLLEQEKIAEERVRADVLADDNVSAVLEAFPEATLESFAEDGAFEPTKGA